MTVPHVIESHCATCGRVSRAAKGADCKSAGLRLRRFESYLSHHQRNPIFISINERSLERLFEHGTAAEAPVSSLCPQKFLVGCLSAIAFGAFGLAAIKQ